MDPACMWWPLPWMSGSLPQVRQLDAPGLRAAKRALGNITSSTYILC